MVVEFLRNFLNGAIWTAAVIAGMGICMCVAMFMLFLLPEEISNRIYDWRHRNDPD